MKALSRFITKFTSLIVAVLSCFDRVIFKGHLALAAPSELEYFVDGVLKLRRTDFMKTRAPQYSDRQGLRIDFGGGQHLEEIVDIERTGHAFSFGAPLQRLLLAE